jgi:uncharacterized protein YegL
MVVDRSGSMQSCRSDAEGGINRFIEDQKNAAGSANLTLVEFDTEYDFVHRAADIKGVGPYKLVPRGNTALNDAVGRAISEAGARLEATQEAERPGAVAVVIVTDGHENSSKEFGLAKVKEMIEHQSSKYNWQFTFLGADIRAAAQGTAMGISPDKVAAFASRNFAEVYERTSAKIGVLRTANLACNAEMKTSAMNISESDRQAYSK